MSKEAMNQALKAMKYAQKFCPELSNDIKALEEALAKQEQGEPVAVAWAAFTEACQRVSSPEQSGELRDAIDRMTDALMERDERAVTPDYVQGHKDGCEWSARLAEASDPRTGDWLYDDPHELAKALRKGPDFGDLYTAPQQRKPLTQQKVLKLKDAFYAGFDAYDTPAAPCSDVDEKWSEYKAAHGIAPQGSDK